MNQYTTESDTMIKHKCYMSEEGYMYFVRSNDDQWEIMTKDLAGYVWSMSNRNVKYNTFEEAQSHLDEVMQDDYFADVYALVPVKELRAEGIMMTDEERISIAKQRFTVEYACDYDNDDTGIEDNKWFTVYAARENTIADAQFLYTTVCNKTVICYKTDIDIEFFVDQYDDIDKAIRTWLTNRVRKYDPSALLEAWGFTKVDD